MIGSSGNINPYGTHAQEHTVTECLHESQPARTEEEGGGVKTGVQQTQEEREKILEESTGFAFLSAVKKGLFGIRTKAADFWNDAGKDNSAVSKTAESVVATAMVKQEEPREESALSEEDSTKKISNVEGAISGGLSREEGSIKKFLQRFEETVEKAVRLIKKPKRNESGTAVRDIEMKGGNSSYLLDSYSKNGEYSTLAKEQSQEGNFRARG